MALASGLVNACSPGTQILDEGNLSLPSNMASRVGGKQALG